MAESDPLQILLQHDKWATTRILDACTKLTDEAFHKRFDMGPGSLHDTQDVTPMALANVAVDIVGTETPLSGAMNLILKGLRS